MILSIFSRQQTALRPCRLSGQRKLLYNPKTTRRRLHNVPQLTYNETFTKNGVGNVFSPAAFNVAWHEYQGHLVKRLNEMTAGHPSGGKETKEILLANARNPNQAALFNHASMAWNNHHFFTTLSPSPTPMTNHLIDRLSGSFSSTESFRAQFLATAQSMFGPGFVWLIRNPASRAYLGHASSDQGNPANDPEFTILCTYIAGSPLPGAHPRAQSVDMNTQNSMSLMNTAGAIGPYSGNIDSMMPPGRMARAEICLGVNTWEHCWMHDHSVGSEGKRAYLDAWWESIDWETVERNAAIDSYGGGRNRLPRAGVGRFR